MKNINPYVEWSKKELNNKKDAFALVGCEKPEGVNLSKLVSDLLLSFGLKPSNQLLDVGCGCFRIGKDLINYLDAGNYFGMDACENILEQGREKVLGIKEKRKEPQILQSWSFEFEKFNVTDFDFILAQSLITHLPEADVRLLFKKIDEFLAPGGKAFISFIEKPRNDRDNFWWEVADLKEFAKETNLTFHYIGEWGHPRNQNIFYFSRPNQSSRKWWRW